MPTSVYVDDFFLKARWHLLIDEEEMRVIDDRWDKPESLIIGLSNGKGSGPFFKNCRVWSDLRPIQLKFLLTRNFVLMDMLTEEERLDDSHPTVDSFNFLIAALIKCLEVRGDCVVESLKIQRLDKDTLNFDFRGTLLLELGDIPPPKEMKLSVVVDNTKD